MIIVEVIYHLALLDVSEINITSLSGPPQIIVLRKNIIVLKPAFIGKHSSKLIVSSFDDKDLLVDAAAVTPLPSIHIDVLFLVGLIFLVLTAIYINVISVFYLGLLWQIYSRKRFWFVLQTSKLLICHIVELYPTSVFTFALKQFYKTLLDLLGFHRQ